jgi:hypothetical protein
VAAKPKVDYDRIEPDWRAGIKSPAQIAAEYTEATGVTVSRAAIVKHFKTRGVPRDLKAKIRAKADAMVAASMVAATVSPATKARDDAIVGANAAKVAHVQLTQRADFARIQKVFVALLLELEQQTEHRDAYDELLLLVVRKDDPEDAEAARDRARRLREAFDRAMSLSSRVETFRKLADARRILFDKECEAYGIGADAGGAGLPMVTIKDYTGRAR